MRPTRNIAVGEVEPEFARRMRLMTTGGFMAGGVMCLAILTIFLKVVVEGFAPIPTAISEAALPDISGRSLGEEGAYHYGHFAPFPNGTFSSVTLTVTLTQSSVVTETVVSSIPVVGSTTESVLVTSTTTTNATVTDYHNHTTVSSTADVQTASTASSSAIVGIGTDELSTSSCTSTVNSEQSSTTVSSMSTAMPTFTSTTTVPYSSSDYDETTDYSSTVTVTVTPLVTTTEVTSVTLTPGVETSVSDTTFTVTFVAPLTSTEAQTGAVGTSTSTVAVGTPEPVTVTITETNNVCTFESTVLSATSEPLTLTVTETVIPVLTYASTTEVTGPSVTSSETTAVTSSTSETVVTALFTSTIMIGPGNPTIVTYATTFTVTPAVDLNPTTLSATRTPYPVNGTLSWTTESIKGTSSTLVQTLTPNADETITPSLVTFGTASAQGPQPTYTRNPMRSGASRRWGRWDGEGEGSVTCVVMLASVVIATILLMV